ncbi:neocarzinostatin apoprotein domain-containing protein [Streptomyces sp. NPDC102278]|uniref:neocarzinostatin apoprotein domain-containing protein n=1 Tax=Streptomyces sp. NPDC102278 TaxID=3366152 RepID=UPI00382EC8E5
MTSRRIGARTGGLGTAVLGAVASALVGGLLPASPAVAQAPAPAGSPVTAAPGTSGARLDVRRTTGLLDGDVVTFTIAGGPPKDQVWVKQCGPSAAATPCDEDTGRQFRVYPDGTYQPSPKKLYARLDTGAGSIDCRTATRADPCTLALTDNAGVLLATVPLRFRPDGRPEAPPALRVTPDTGLVDGRSVRVTGKGYEPRFHALVMECAAGSTSTLGCRARSRPPATSDGGRIDETVVLSARFTAIDGRTIDCLPRGACELVVFGTRVRGPRQVGHPLHFAASASR